MEHDELSQEFIWFVTSSSMSFSRRSMRTFVIEHEPRWTKHVFRPWLVTLWRGLSITVYNHGISHVPIYCVRKWYLWICCGMAIGKNTAIHMGCFVTGRQITVANHSVINRRCYLDGRGGIKIGSNVSISPEVYILTASHLVNSTSFEGVQGKVHIEDYVWIGARAIILPNVTLGKGCVVGAGAVVTKSVLPHEIVAGNPAQVIGKREQNLTYELSYFPLADTDEALPRLF